jgi:F0F1-type ATP synthase epsilon subunit
MLDVKVKTPSGVLWGGEAKSVSSENTEGPFDVLSGHANFVTLINQKPIIVRTTKDKEHKFQFDRAAMYVVNDKVSIYTHLQHKR